MKKNTPTASPETQNEAMKIAKSTQKPGQTKEQTKLIAQGIEKGIALYKKQQKEKMRQADKAKKKQRKEKLKQSEQTDLEHGADLTHDVSESKAPSTLLPWLLLLISWAGFAGYLVFTHQ